MSTSIKYEIAVSHHPNIPAHNHSRTRGEIGLYVCVKNDNSYMKSMLFLFPYTTCPWNHGSEESNFR